LSYKDVAQSTFALGRDLVSAFFGL